MVQRKFRCLYKWILTKTQIWKLRQSRRMPSISPRAPRKAHINSVHLFYSPGNLETQSQTKLLTLLERADTTDDPCKLNRALSIFISELYIYKRHYKKNSSSVWKIYNIWKQMYALAYHTSLGENQIEDNISGKWKGCHAWLGKWWIIVLTTLKFTERKCKAMQCKAKAI